jgi:hypothetical protein
MKFKTEEKKKKEGGGTGKQQEFEGTTSLKGRCPFKLIGGCNFRRIK